MAAFNAILLSIVALCRFDHASSNEASSVVAQRERVYRNVRYRVRDIVGILQTMQQQVSKDAVDDEELFGKYMFYCRKGRASMEASIKEAEDTDLEGLKHTIEGEEETREGLQSTIIDDQAKEADAEAAIEKANSLREYTAEFFSEESANLRKDIATLQEAATVLEKEEALPTPAASLLKQLSGSGDVKKQDREQLASLLQRIREGSEDTMPRSQEILDVVTHMKEAMQHKLSEIVAEEKMERETSQAYKEMIKQKELSIQADIDEKTTHMQELDSEIDAQKDELEDSARYLMEGPAFLPFITASENCTRREDDWADRCQLRTREMLAIAETITILVEDSALDALFEKSMPTAWQEGAKHAMLSASVANFREKEDSKFDLVSLALKGKNASVAKILNVIDGVVSMLGKEKIEIEKEKFCGQSVNQTQDNLQKLIVTVSDLGVVITRHEKSVAELAAENDKIRAGIAKLDKEIIEIAQARKKENEENVEVVAGDAMASHLFQSARERLRSFYSEEAPNVAVGEGASLGEIIGPYVKKSEDSTNIETLLNTTIAELDADKVKVEARENENQKQWERVITSSLEKHLSDVKSMEAKQAEIAELQTTLTTVGKDKTTQMNEVKATTKYLSELLGDHHGFLSPSVCSRTAPLPKTMDPAMPKNFVF
jgi:hypothetical protein